MSPPPTVIFLQGTTSLLSKSHVKRSCIQVSLVRQQNLPGSISGWKNGKGGELISLPPAPYTLLGTEFWVWNSHGTGLIVRPQGRGEENITCSWGKRKKARGSREVETDQSFSEGWRSFKRMIAALDAAPWPSFVFAFGKPANGQNTCSPMAMIHLWDHFEITCRLFYCLYPAYLSLH